MNDSKFKHPTGKSEIILYQTEDGTSKVNVLLDGDTVWLSLNMMAVLYQTTKQNISLHVNNIFEEQELTPISTVKKYLTVQTEGTREVTREIEYYNLEMIIAVGFRVRSHIGTQFRRWAIERTNEFLVKGFVLDDERLMEGHNLGVDYFDELLERIRNIRASEKRFYSQIKDLYALSIDYEPKSEITINFFKNVQNKLHWAIAGHTAAEIIASRVDASKKNMGLTCWKGSKVRKSDVSTAKNYLSQDEISELNRFVVMYLDYAEDQTRRRKPIYMKDWAKKLDAFLSFNEREILKSLGKVSMEEAKQLAEDEYEKFNKQRLHNEALEANQIEDAELKQIEDNIKKIIKK